MKSIIVNTVEAIDWTWTEATTEISEGAEGCIVEKGSDKGFPKVPKLLRLKYI